MHRIYQVRIHTEFAKTLLTQKETTEILAVLQVFVGTKKFNAMCKRTLNEINLTFYIITLVLEFLTSEGAKDSCYSFRGKGRHFLISKNSMPCVNGPLKKRSLHFSASICGIA